MNNNKMIVLFQKIWNDRPKQSIVSGFDLSCFNGTNFFVNCFAHVVAKNGHNQLIFHDKKLKDELLRYNPDNILLVTPKEHYLIDHGTQEQRAKYEAKYNVSFAPFYNYKEVLIETLKFKINNHK